VGDVVSFLTLFLASSVGFLYHLLYSLNSSTDGDAEIVVLVLSPLAALSLKTAVKLYSTSVYILYRAPYSCFPFTSCWRFLLVYAVFWMVGAHFGLSPNDARVYPARRAMAVSTLRTVSLQHWRQNVVVCCFRILTSGIQSSLTRASEMLGSYISRGTSCLRPGRGLRSQWLHQRGEGCEFTTCNLLW
jgi:predicted permease